MAYDVTTDIGRVRLLLNDVDESNLVFADNEVQAFLDLEGGSVKRAAATAIDANASNLALATRVLRTQDLQTDGAKLADALRKHAATLREQADADEERGDDFYFDLIDPLPDPYGLYDWRTL